MASLCRRLAPAITKLSNISSKTSNVAKNHSFRNVWKLSTNNNIRKFSTAFTLQKRAQVTLSFITPDGEKLTTKAKVGDNLLDVIVDNDIDIDGFGACEGTLACSTCHLIFTPEQFEIINEKPSDEELDMLDLAFQLEDTSRLGCQVIVTNDMEGWEICVPAGVADAREP